MATVSAWMSTDVMTVGQDDSLWETLDRMWEARISGLPVVDGNGDLIGLITKRDIYGQCANQYELMKVRVDEVMQTKVLAVEPGDSLNMAVSVMLENRVNRLPVVSAGRLVGVITRTDMIASLAAAR